MSPRIGPRPSHPVTPPRTEATNPKGAALPTPAAPADAFSDVHAGQRTRSLTPERAAALTYRRHGDDPHTLSDRGDVGRLISRTPQLDDVRGTAGDATRCGGAAMFNAMLLDGDAVANADALSRVAAQRHVTLSADETSALSSMREGHLTPREAAHLQEALYRVSDAGDPSATGAGLSGLELARTVTALQGAGGFPNTREVNFRSDRTGPASFHWTVTSRTASGTAHADSWPQANGYATVTAGPGRTEFHRDGHFERDFIADVTLRRDLDGTHIRTRYVDDSTTAGAIDGTPAAVRSMEIIATPSGAREGNSLWLNPDTGAMTLPPTR